MDPAKRERLLKELASDRRQTTVVEAQGGLDDMRIVTRSAQDIGPTLKSIEQLKHQHQAVGESKDLKHVARIPMVLVEEIYKRTNGEVNLMRPRSGDLAKVRRMLNDRDYAKLRVNGGKL